MSYLWLFHSYRAKHFFVKFSKPFLGFCFLYLWYQIDFYIVTKNLSWILRGLPSSEVKRPPQGRQMKFRSCFDTKFDVVRKRDFLYQINLLFKKSGGPPKQNATKTHQKMLCFWCVFSTCSHKEMRNKKNSKLTCKS